MPKRNRFKKVLKITGFSLVTFIVILLVLPFFLRSAVERMLREKISDATHHLYSVEFKLDHFSFLPGSISLSDVELTPNDEQWEKIRPANVYSLSAGQIKLDGILFYSFILRGSWTIRKIRIEDAKIVIAHNPNGEKISLGSRPQKTTNLFIGKLEIRNADLEVWNYQTNEKRFTCKLTTGQLKKIHVKGTQPLELGASSLTFSPLQLQTKSGKEIGLDHVTINTREREASIHIGKVAVDEMLDALGDKEKSLFQANSFDCGVDSLIFSVKDFTQWPSLLKKSAHGIIVHSVMLYQPSVTFYPGRTARRDTLGLDPFSNRSSTPFMIERIEVRNGNINVVDHSEKFNIVATKNFNLVLSHLRNTPSHFKFPVFANSIYLSTDSVVVLTEKGIMKTEIRNLKITKKEEEVVISDLSYGPTIDPDSFYRYKGYQMDYTQLQVRQGSIRDIRFDKLLSKIEFECREMEIDSAGLHLFRDKNYPLNTVKRPKFPQAQIREIPVPLYIDSVQLHNSYIHYKELAKNGKDTGNFFINQISAGSKQITNRPEILAIQDSLQFNFAGEIYGSGLLKGTLTLYMNSENGKHKVSGSIGKMKANVLNAITVPSAKMMIRGGLVHGGNFLITADEKEATGTLLLRFEKLRVALYDEKDGEMEVNKIKTFIANLFIVRENPEPGKEPVISMISYERDPSRWVINYWWKSILNGINNIILARKNDIIQLKKGADDLKKLQQEKKQQQKANQDDN